VPKLQLNPKLSNEGLTITDQGCI